MDCRHAFCYKCLVGWFEAHGPSCPGCRELTALPRRDFPLCDIASWVFIINGQEAPTAISEGVDHEQLKTAYGAACTNERLRQATAQMEQEAIEQWRAHQGRQVGEVVIIDDDDVMTEVEGSEWEVGSEHGEDLEGEEAL